MLCRGLRARREAAGISQEALGYKAGLHRTYVSMLERGVRNPTLTVIAKLAGALDTADGDANWRRGARTTPKRVTPRRYRRQLPSSPCAAAPWQGLVQSGLRQELPSVKPLRHRA